MRDTDLQCMVGEISAFREEQLGYGMLLSTIQMVKIPVPWEMVLGEMGPYHD